jgi:hypothetical protein
MHTLTDTAACAESEEIARVRVRVGGGFGERAEIVSVAVWVETAGVRVAEGV